jgi:hypothetical protein
MDGAGPGRQVRDGDLRDADLRCDAELSVGVGEDEAVVHASLGGHVVGCRDHL